MTGPVDHYRAISSSLWRLVGFRLLNVNAFCDVAAASSVWPHHSDFWTCYVRMSLDNLATRQVSLVHLRETLVT